MQWIETFILRQIQSIFMLAIFCSTLLLCFYVLLKNSLKVVFGY